MQTLYLLWFGTMLPDLRSVFPVSPCRPASCSHYCFCFTYGYVSHLMFTCPYIPLRHSLFPSRCSPSLLLHLCIISVTSPLCLIYPPATERISDCQHRCVYLPDCQLLLTSLSWSSGYLLSSSPWSNLVLPPSPTWFLALVLWFLCSSCHLTYPSWSSSSPGTCCLTCPPGSSP